VLDLTGFYIWIGVGLLLAGVVGLVKLGLWVWIMTRVFHHPTPAPPAPAAAEPSGGTASTAKAWLGVIAAALGIVTTVAGLLKECGPAKPASNGSVSNGPSYTPVTPPSYTPVTPPSYTPVTPPSYTPVTPPPPTLSAMCCTYAGNCHMMMVGQVGMVCTCMDMFGNIAQGTVCQ
jgi:hypothetical protein